MRSVLVTGATGFVGYHLVKQLVERGIRPRALARRSSDTTRLRSFPVDLIEGDVTDLASLRRAAKGVDTLFHVAGLVSTNPADAERLLQVNLFGTGNVLQAAMDAGVQRVVVTSSVAAVGMSRDPEPLDEEADWGKHEMKNPYAFSKRQAEEAALAAATSGFSVVVVNPSVVIGPEDFGSSAGGKHLKDAIERRLPGTIRMGISYVDVRDVAAGHLLAAERGRSGHRYILSAENRMLEAFFREVAEAAGVPPPRWRVPVAAARAAALLVEAWSVVTRQPPLFTRAVLQVAGNYTWYDASCARRELGWNPRPLAETIADAVRWLKERKT